MDTLLLRSPPADQHSLPNFSGRRRRFFAWSAGLSAACVTAALLLSSTLKVDDYARLQDVQNMDGKWIFAPSSKAKPVLTALDEEGTDSQLPEGVNWGSLDCGFHGPAFESRALGCDRAGGCGATPMEKRSNTLKDCGDNSHYCISSFKSCLRDKGTTGTSKPNYNICDCYVVVSGLGEGRCDDLCTSAIFSDYGELTERCFKFDAYAGCLYLDRYRDPSDRRIFAKPAPVPAQPPSPPASPPTPPAPEADPAAVENGSSQQGWPYGQWPSPWTFPYGTKDKRKPAWNRGFIAKD